AESGSATGTRTFTLYKDSVTSANKVAEAVLTYSSANPAIYGGTIDFGSTTASSDTAALAAGWTNYKVSTSTSTSFISTEIAAGGSKTFILVADTTTPKTTNNATSYINPTIKASGTATGGTFYGITWADGDTSTGTGITTVDTLPLDSTSKTLSW
ncbi:MAG TPA: hypothetical protein PKL20_01980, partial [Candidatus Paceibacterota bacterium]|nr:hypothetical protein [Candidatus Paceibacterota bacterium]